MRVELKTAVPYILIWVVCIAAQAMLAQEFRPTPASLHESRTITGAYTVSGGSGVTRESTVVAGVSLFCSVTYVGPQDACPARYAGHNVTVRLATYRHVFGTGEVVLQISAAGGSETVFSRDRIIEIWWIGSLFMGGLAAAISAGLLCLAYTRLTKQRITTQRSFEIQ